MCPVEREDLTLPGASRPFQMCDWNCYNQSCPSCGIRKHLPVDDILMTENTDEVSLMVWENLPRAGGREQLENVERTLTVGEVFQRLL